MAKSFGLFPHAWENFATAVLLQLFRACTNEEIALLEPDAAAIRAAERAEDEALRDEWFALLLAECSEADAKQR